MKYSAKTVLSFRKGLDSINMGISLKNTLDLKNSPPPGRGLPQHVGLQGFQILLQFQGKAR